MDDFFRLELPSRRLSGIVGAQRAGRIDATVDLGDLAFLAFGVTSDHARIVRQQRGDVIDKTFAHIVGDFEIVAEIDVALIVDEFHIACCGDDVGGLVPDDPVGQQHRFALDEFHMAGQHDDVVDLVLLDMILGVIDRRVLIPADRLVFRGLCIGIGSPRERQNG